MESTSPNFDQQQHQQQQLLQDSHFVGCSPSPSAYGVSTSLEWNPITTIFSTSGTSSNSNFINKLYENEFIESRTNHITHNATIPITIDNDARNLTYLQSNLPKMEEDMLSSFTNFNSLLQNPSTRSMENQTSWFNGFPSPGAQFYNNNNNNNNNNRGLMQLPVEHGFPSSSFLNQLGLVSSPNSTSVFSSGAPRLGLNMQAMDFLGNNACFGSHNRSNSYDVVGEEVISPLGKTISSNKSGTGRRMNGITGTKRTATNYSSDQSKTSTSTNDSGAPTPTPTTKKSQLKVSCPPFKVRKEKLGDRIAGLHQLVSPFGKTDTASVLTEAIGYIQFLQDQIHTLCMPHAKAPRNNPCRQFHMGAVGAGEEDEEQEEARVELQRRGLCLVPLSWTSFVTPTQLDLDPSFF